MTLWLSGGFGPSKAGRRAKTQVNYRIVVRHITEWFGPEPVQRVTQSAILDFEAGLWERNYAAGTIRNIRRVLLAVLALAHVDGLRDRPPELPFIKDPGRGRIKHLSPPEAARVLAVAEPAHRFLYFTLGHASPAFTLRVYGHLIRRPGRAAGLDAVFHALSNGEGRGKDH